MEGSPPQYEFSEAQNRTLRELSSRMTWVGTFGLAVGVMLALLGILTLDQLGVVLVTVSVFILLTSVWTRSTALSFRRVVDTEGSDIDNIMAGVDALRKLYNLQYWLALVAIVFAVIGLVASGALVL